jgi:hypothetical protein
MAAFIIRRVAQSLLVLLTVGLVAVASPLVASKR